MSKAINALINAAEVESDSITGTKLTFLDFTIPKHGCREVFVKRKNNRVPHERVTTEVREVKYLRDGFVKEEGELKARKIVLESFGTEIVKEILVPAGSVTTTPKVVGQVIRDLRRREE